MKVTSSRRKYSHFAVHTQIQKRERQHNIIKYAEHLSDTKAIQSTYSNKNTKTLHTVRTSTKTVIVQSNRMKDEVWRTKWRTYFSETSIWTVKMVQKMPARHMADLCMPFSSIRRYWKTYKKAHIQTGTQKHAQIHESRQTERAIESTQKSGIQYIKHKTNLQKFKL